MTEPTAAHADKDPLDRLALVENALVEAQQREGVLASILAERDGRIAALEATVDVFRQAEASRRESAVQGYLHDLQAKATGLQSPVPAEDMDKVASLFAAGQDEVAKILGDAFLSRAEAQARAAGAPAANATPIGVSSGKTAIDRNQFVVDMLKASGVNAELRDGHVVTTPKKIAL